MKSRIAFVVGHSHWGKSCTLRALTNNDYRPRRTTIKKCDFYIRRMSNDDRPQYDPDSYFHFMTSLAPAKTPFLIASFCPNFSSSKTEKMLRSLRKKGYELYFWVIKHQFGTSAVVTQTEIGWLKGMGKVEVFSGVKEASVRATRFRQFVSNVVLA